MGRVEKAGKAQTVGVAPAHVSALGRMLVVGSPAHHVASPAEPAHGVQYSMSQVPAAMKSRCCVCPRPPSVAPPLARAAFSRAPLVFTPRGSARVALAPGLALRVHRPAGLSARVDRLILALQRSCVHCCSWMKARSP